MSLKINDHLVVATSEVAYMFLSHRYDFFLVSQHVRQGTVTPTHYNVVADSSGLKADHMQRFITSNN